jgi:hypothetical protein
MQCFFNEFFKSQSGDSPYENVAKSGYEPEINKRIFNHHSVFLATQRKPSIRIWRLILFFSLLPTKETSKIASFSDF